MISRIAAVIGAAALLALAACSDSPGPVAPAAKPGTPSHLIIPVAGTFTQVTVGGTSPSSGQTCGVVSDGSVECWGFGTTSNFAPSGGVSWTQFGFSDAYRCLGNADLVSCTSAAITPGGGSQFTQMTVGGQFACALRADGVVQCTASNPANVAAPATKTAATGKFIQVAAGSAHACAVRNDGVVECWGNNTFGQAPATKTPPATLHYKQVSAALVQTCAVRDDGAVQCWGSGAATHTATTGTFKQVSAGPSSACALRNDGVIECWDGTSAGEAPPTKTALTGVFTQVDVGAMHGCGLRDDGVIECWGTNLGGETLPTRSPLIEIPPTAKFTVTPTVVYVGRSFTLSLTQTAVAGHPEVTFTYAFDCGDGNGYGAFTANNTVTCSPSTDGTIGVRGKAQDQSGDVVEKFASIDVLLDKSEPVITPTITGTLGTHGWYKSNVTVSWEVTDDQTDVTSPPCEPTTIDADTPGQDVKCLATSRGGTTSKTVTIKRDVTRPTIAFSAVSPAANAGGWNNTSVGVSWTCTDVTSGVVSATATQSVMTEGQNQSAKGTCSDNAGNTAQDTHSGINIDLTAPSLAPTISPTVILMGSAPTVAANGTDGLSGIGTQVCGLPSTAAVGNTSVSCTVTDKAGNTATKSVSYGVTYQFSGFMAPVNDGVLNIAKAGQTIPLKWRIVDANGAPISNLTMASIGVASLACSSGTSADEVEEYAAGASGLQNLGNGNYQFNWKTPKDYAGSCKTLQLDLGEGTPRLVGFQFTK